MKETTDTQYYDNLAEKAAQDTAAFDELYLHFFPRIYNFLFSRMKESDAVDEVISVTFEKVYRNLAAYKKERAAFSTWIFRIALNGMNDFYRQRQRRQESSWEDVLEPAAPARQTPEQQALMGETQSELLRAVDQLKEREQRLIALKYWSGLSNREIAAIENMSPGNVAIVLHRAIASLKLKIQENPENHL